MMRYLLLALLVTLGLACSSGNEPAGTGNGGSGGTQEDPKFANSLEDTDSDGLPNYLETRLGTDLRDHHDPYRYGNYDFENYWGPAADGIPDGLERYLVGGGARAPVTLLSDSDADGIPDYFEVRFRPDPFNGSDPVKRGGEDNDDTFGPGGDGITDGLEAFLVALGAESPVTRWTDSDADLSPDYAEVFLGSHPFDAASHPNSMTDHDGDGLPTYLEALLGSQPYGAEDPFADGSGDRDGDGLLNGLEDYLASLIGYPQDAILYSTESDGDGIPDVHEIVEAASAPDDPNDPVPDGARDTDDDLLPDGLETYLAHLGGRDGKDIKRSTDFDGDGLPEALEVTLRNGMPADPHRPFARGNEDKDSNGVTNAVEEYLSHLGGEPPIMEPITATTDSDCDGRPDATEVPGGFDPQTIDLEPYASRVKANVIRFNHNGQFQNNSEVRFVAMRALSTQGRIGADFVNLHEVRFRDTLGRVLPVSKMRIENATPLYDRIPVEASAEIHRVIPIDPNPPENLFDGVLLDDSDPDPTRWLALDSPSAEGMFTATQRAPYAYVVIDLGADYDLGDMLIWNGLQARGHAVDKLQVQLFSAALAHDFPGGPGGLERADGTSTLEFWVRSDRGTSTHYDGDLVDYWNDLSGHERHATAVGGDRPTYQAISSANGLPAIHFDLDGMTLTRPVQENFTIFAVAASKQTDGHDWLTAEGSFFGVSMTGCPGIMGMGFNNRKFYWADCTPARVNKVINDGLAHIMAVTRDLTTLLANLYLDGAYGVTTGTQSDPLDAAATWGLGQLLYGGRLIGEMWELFAISRVLSATELNILDNALSAKYGVTIPEDRYGFDLTHGQEVAGIGRTTGSDEVNHGRASDWVEIYNPSALSDGDRLFWGTDRVDTFSISYDVPFDCDRRHAQTWAFQETDGGAGDGVGTVSVRFYLELIDPYTSGGAYVLLIEDDTRFRDCRTRLEDGAIDPQQRTVTFHAVELGPSGYFALAIQDP
ncbi:MAG: hypothetical protein AB1486_03220 [Planctomycetota bacterium]